MRDIKQVTNYDFNKKSNTYPIPIGNNETININYVTVELNSKVVKIGYCAGDSSIQYPLYLHGNKNVQVYPGKEGMYEVERETTGYDLDPDQDNSDYEMDIKGSITSIEVPQSYTDHETDPEVEYKYTFVLDQVEET